MGDGFPSPVVRSRDGVRNLARLLHLDLGLGDGVTQSLASGSRLRGSDVESHGDGVAGHGLGLLLEEGKHRVPPRGGFLLLLGVGALALLVARVESGEQFGGLLHHFGGQGLVADDGLVEFAVGHDVFPFCALGAGVGRYPFCDFIIPEVRGFVKTFFGFSKKFFLALTCGLACSLPFCDYIIAYNRANVKPKIGWKMESFLCKLHFNALNR